MHCMEVVDCDSMLKRMRVKNATGILRTASLFAASHCTLIAQAINVMILFAGIGIQWGIFKKELLKIMG